MYILPSCYHFLLGYNKASFVVHIFFQYKAINIFQFQICVKCGIILKLLENLKKKGGVLFVFLIKGD